MKTENEQEILLDDMPAEQRSAHLNEKCDKSEIVKYEKDLTENEITIMKNRQVHIAIELEKLEKQKKEVNAEFAEKIKPLKSEQHKLLQNIDEEILEKEEQLYGFYNQIEGIVKFYDPEGHYVMKREMFPTEKQTTINSEQSTPEQATEFPQDGIEQGEDIFKETEKEESSD